VTTGLEFRVVRNELEFEALRPEWERVYFESTPRNPYLSWDWTAACLESFCQSGSLFVPTLWRGGHLVAALPLCREHRLGFRVLRFIAEERANYLGVLSRPGDRWAVPPLLACLEQARSQWDLVFLRRLAVAYNHMAVADVPAPLVTTRAFGPGSPCLRLEGDWNGLLSAGPPQLRHSARWVRKLEREGGVVEHRPGADALGMLDEIADVEAHSWKKAAGIAYFLQAPNRKLAARALSSLGARGEMEVWAARIEGRLIAYLLTFVTPERVMYWQGAYHADHRKRYAGGVLHHHAIRQACQSGRNEYDFMLGTEEYKSGWTNAEHEQNYVSIHPATARGRLAFALLVAPRWYFRQHPSARRVHTSFIRLRQRLRGAFQ
jgi:CelD/BcsL family acetyltransferase involved in cellulose biosynthesis